MGTEKERLRRLSVIFGILEHAKKNGKEIATDTWINDMMQKWGCTRKTAVEYLAAAFRRLNKNK